MEVQQAVEKTNCQMAFVACGGEVQKYVSRDEIVQTTH